MAHNQEGENRRGKENESNLPTTVRTLLQREWARFSRRGKTKKNNRAKKMTTVAEVDCEPCTLARADEMTRDFNDILPISDEGHQHYDGVDNRTFDISGAQKKRILQRGMDRLRRSFRKSLYRSKTKASSTLTPLAVAHSAEPVAAQSAAALASTKEAGKKKSQNYCLLDEAAVRAAACSFHVKYLGACEVFDSKGLHICESALQHLRVKRQVAKAILYVSGDGIRLVDQEKNHGLILDQTIEKVSFCAPDRFNDKGFAYICRDGASRRWMCHGFHAIKDSGERLSHAVGCAFTICLETKRKMDAEMAAYRSAQQLASAVATSAPSVSGANLTNGKSFRRQYSLLERRLDPQIAKSITNSSSTDHCCGSALTTDTTTNIENGVELEQAHCKKSCNDNVNSTVVSTEAANALSFTLAKPRPTPNMQLFDRQESFRAPIQSSCSLNSFKRFNSLRGGDDGIERGLHHLYPTLYNEPIYEGNDNCHADGTETSGVHVNVAHQPLAGGDALFTRATTATYNRIKQNNSLFPISFSDMESALVDEERPQSSRADEWLNDVWRRSIMRPAPTTSRSTVFNGEYQYPSSSGIAQPSNSGEPDALLLSHSRSADNFWLAEVKSGGLPPPVQPPPPLPPSLQLQAKEDASKAGDGVSGVVSTESNGQQLTIKSPDQSLHHLTKRISDFSVKVGTPPKAAGDYPSVSNGNNGKAPLTRRTIKYRLLEETDGPPNSVPNSPQSSLNAGDCSSKHGDGTMSNGSRADATKRSGDDNGRFSIDPFDVEWSAEILRRTKNATQPCHSSFKSDSVNGRDDRSINALVEGEEALTSPVASNNPFFQEESAAVNV